MLVSKGNMWGSCGCLFVAMLLALMVTAVLPTASAKPPTQTSALVSPSKSPASQSTPAAKTAAAVAGEGKAAVQPPPEKPTAEFCLGCHGPFETLAQRTSNYVTDQGEKVNPHVYVPHDSKKITTCNDCHEVHPLTVTSPSNIAKANVQYCYSACHHVNDFTPCVQCHKDKK